MSKRRMNGDGTITQRADGRWEARLSLPDGSRKSFYGKTKEEVNNKKKQATKDVDNGLPLITGRQTVKQYLESWIEEVKPQLGLGTWTNYKGYVRNHLVPALGSTVLHKVTVPQVQRLYTQLIDNGLASGTVHRIHSMLHRAFNDAFRIELIQRNMLDLVKAPKVDTREMQTLSEEQARTFLEGVKGNRFEALYVLALTTGMRQGELLGLRWQDVNLEKGFIVITVALHRVGSKVFMGKTKTAHSQRKIALTPLAIDALQRHFQLQQRERVFFSKTWDTTVDLVFRNTVGKAQHSDVFTHHLFPKLLKKMGLPKMRFHDLRHTCATLLLSRGVNVKVVSELLGHSDVTITLRIYGHVMPHMQQTAVDVMQQMTTKQKLEE